MTISINPTLIAIVLVLWIISSIITMERLTRRIEELERRENIGIYIAGAGGGGGVDEGVGKKKNKKKEAK